MIYLFILGILNAAELVLVIMALVILFREDKMK